MIDASLFLREKRLRYLWILIGAAGLLLAIALASRQRSPGHTGQLTRGSPAPEFSVITLDGKQLDLAGYRGKVILLDFWATWCGPCRDEIPLFVQLQDKYRDRGLQIIGISMDDGPEPVRQFYRDFHMNYPVALGGARLGELYGGVLGLPIAFLIGRDGRIYAKQLGPSSPSLWEGEITRLLAENGSSAGEPHPAARNRPKCYLAACNVQSNALLPQDRVKPASLNSQLTTSLPTTYKALIKFTDNGPARA